MTGDEKCSFLLTFVAEFEGKDSSRLSKCYARKEGIGYIHVSVSIDGFCVPRVRVLLKQGTASHERTTSI